MESYLFIPADEGGAKAVSGSYFNVNGVLFIVVDAYECTSSTNASTIELWVMVAAANSV